MILTSRADPIGRWLYAERYLSVGARSYGPFSAINEIGAEYRPESETPDFEVACVIATHPSKAHFLTSPHPASNRLKSLYSRANDDICIPIHPAAMPMLAPHAPQTAARLPEAFRLRVSPTASTRTVYVHATSQDQHKHLPHFVKLHFPGRISRFARALTRKDVEAQLWVSQQLQASMTPHLPDVGGGYIDLGEGGSVGFILRSSVPNCSITGTPNLIPTFALYAGDHHAGNDPPLLAQLPSLFGEDATSFVTKRIVAPAVRLWVNTVQTLGIFPELHGQNLLFCFDGGFSSSELVMRDCEVYVDAELRKSLGLSSPAALHLSEHELVQRDRPQLLSLCYDGFLARNLLEEVAACASKHLAVNRNELRACAIEEFKAAGGHYLGLPAGVFYYEDVLHEGSSFVLTERESRPAWR